MKKILLSLTGLLLLWAAAAAVIARPFFPAPHAVFLEFFRQLNGGELKMHLGISLLRVLGAQASAFIPALFLGIGAGRNRTMDKLLTPAAYILFPIPKAALLPVILLFFGLGNFSKIFLVALILFFQFYLSIRDEVKNLDRRYFDSLYTLGAGPFQTLFHLILPAILPRILSTFRLTLGTAVAVLFLAETFATRTGIGYFIMEGWSLLDYPRMYAGITGLSLMGLVLFLLVELAERKFCRWTRRLAFEPGRD